MALMQKSSVAASSRVSTRCVVAARPTLRKAVVVRASHAQQPSRAAVFQAAVIAGTAAALANPLVAEAAVTPSLKNFLGSLVAGGVVILGIAAAVTAVSGFDPVNRG
ncbi:hypothetical protein FOA52_011947 [Chlamydomonas sp. UWO 241]|nr:hypothetical protein FOA52_011947 [Chlamydomonas sp. UWO 241]